VINRRQGGRRMKAERYIIDAIIAGEVRRVAQAVEDEYPQGACITTEDFADWLSWLAESIADSLLDYLEEEGLLHEGPLNYTMEEAEALFVDIDDGEDEFIMG